MFWTRLLCVLAAGLCAGTLCAQTVFTVSNTNDSGAGSLRQAILDANSTANQLVSMVPVPDEIRFQATTIGTVTLASALPVITEAVTIIGSGRTTLIINGGGNFRIFETSLGTALGVSRMTLQGGSAVQGGGMLTRGGTSVFDVVFNNCDAAGPNSGSGAGGDALGGGIYHSPVALALVVTNCLFTDCRADAGNGTNGGGGWGQGGAIFVNSGSASLLQVTFQFCYTTGGSDAGTGAAGAASGGAVYALAPLTLTDCVIRDCAATGGAVLNGSDGGSADGGAIASGSTLTLSNCTIENCEAAGGTATGTGVGGNAFGGGITSYAGSASLTRVLIDSCDAVGGAGNLGFTGVAFGGAIYGEVNVTYTEGEITACHAINGNSQPGNGGGFFHEGATALQIVRSTVAECIGGGIVAEGSSTVLISNSTISGNSGGVIGGVAIANTIATLSFTTITLNSGTVAGGVLRNSGTLTIVGCVIAQNTSAGAPDIDSNNSMTIQNSVVGVQDPDFITTAGNNNSFGTPGLPLSAALAALADNGGPTRTHALLTGSPAINGGGTTGVPATDQRNAPRNVGEADAGSYEFGANVPGGQSDAGGEGDERCSTGHGGLPWMALLALLALGLLAPRMRRAKA